VARVAWPRFVAVGRLQMVHMIVALVASALSVLLFRAKPPTVRRGALWRDEGTACLRSPTRESLWRRTLG